MIWGSDRLVIPLERMAAALDAHFFFGAAFFFAAFFFVFFFLVAFFLVAFFLAFFFAIRLKITDRGPDSHGLELPSAEAAALNEARWAAE